MQRSFTLLQGDVLDCVSQQKLHEAFVNSKLFCTVKSVNTYKCFV